jgi:hypothetical protein
MSKPSLRPPNNPAARLYVLFEDLWTSSQQIHNCTMRQAIGHALGLGNLEDVELAIIIADIQRLGREVHRIIVDEPLLDTEAHLDGFSTALSAFALGRVDHSLLTDGNKLDPSKLKPLKFAALHLSILESKEPTATDEELSAGIEAIRAAREEIRNRNLPEDVLTPLLRILAAIEHALLQYRFGGIDAFCQAWEQVVGIVASQPSKRAAVDVEMSTGAPRTVWEWFWGQVVRSKVPIEIASHALSATKDGTELLRLLPPTIL